jgi:hypothetical protein
LLDLSETTKGQRGRLAVLPCPGNKARACGRWNTGKLGPLMSWRCRLLPRTRYFNPLLVRQCDFKEFTALIREIPDD